MDKITDIILGEMQNDLFARKNLVRINMEKAYKNTDFKKADIAYREALLSNMTSKNEEHQKKLDNAQKKRAACAKKAGIDLESLEVKYNCSLCKDKGIKKDGSLCKCVLQKIKNYKIKENKKQGFDFTFEMNKIASMKVKQSAALSKIYKHMEGFCKRFPETDFLNYLIVGGVGVGKSCLLSAVANEMLKKGRSVNFTTAFSMNKAFLDYHLSSGIRSLSPFTEPELLIIDDLGSEQIFKNVTVEYLFCILDDRIRNKKHTIISSNLNFSMLEERYTQRITSRLSAKENSCLLNIDGDDLRTK